MSRKAGLGMSMVVGGLILSGAAQAGFIGHSIEATAYFPDLPPGAGVVGGPVTAVVGPGLEFADGQFGAFFGPSFDFADTTITITHAQSGHQPGTFNGYSFFDVFASIDPIIGVSIVSDNSGFFLGDPTRVFFDANTVFVNFESLDFAGIQNPEILLSVQFGPGGQVPEPATLALLGLGLAGFAVRARRQSSAG